MSGECVHKISRRNLLPGESPPVGSTQARPLIEPANRFDFHAADRAGRVAIPALQSLPHEAFIRRALDLGDAVLPAVRLFGPSRARRQSEVLLAAQLGPGGVSRIDADDFGTERLGAGDHPLARVAPSLEQID